MYTCVSYTGCSSGHPTRWCAFDGDHTPSPKDSGQTTTWNPTAPGSAGGGAAASGEASGAGGRSGGESEKVTLQSA
ncbi:uncharacterized protein SOCE26_016950 [Sorangium cellulosum]|uniref:Uncharacterized protein n=1 Tax=Sorangium cellulosum TaxID=56 RepID=A0A2L0ELX9_SORCE|nr:uncharacterized protein SOCE26_016950 [Sorangium cellulosum]